MNRSGMWLRLLLACYFPFLALLWLGIGWLEWTLIERRLFIFPPVVLLMVVLAIPFLQIPWACRCLFWRLPADQSEIKLPRKDLRRLYDFVAEVAEERQLPMPERIRFSGETIAHVYCNGKDERVLVLGGMALMCFSQKVIAAIVAHELGHFAAGDTELTRRCFRRRRMMGVLESNLTLAIWPSGPVTVGGVIRVNPLFWVMINLFNPIPWIIVGYHRLFELAYAVNSREQAYAADRHSAGQSGPEATGESLIFMGVLEHTPYAHLSTIATSHLATNTHLDKIFSEQAQRAGGLDAYEWQRACKKALGARTHWFDSHPCLKDRLKALGISSKKAQEMTLDQADSPPATQLIDNWKELESRMTGKLMGRFQEHYQFEQDMAQVMQHLAGKGRQ